MTDETFIDIIVNSKGGDAIYSLTKKDILNPNKNLQKLEELTDLQLNEAMIETLLENNSFLIDENISIIGRQVPFLNGNDKIDLLALKPNGNIAIIETKSGTIPTNSLSQLINYVSLIYKINKKNIINQIKNYKTNKNNKFNIHKYLDNFLNKEAIINNNQELYLLGRYNNKKLYNQAVFLQKKYNLNINIITFSIKKLNNKSKNIIIDSKKHFLVENKTIKTKIKTTKITKQKHLKNCTKNNKNLINTFEKCIKENYSNINFNWNLETYVLIQKNTKRIMKCFIYDDSIKLKMSPNFRSIFNKDKFNEKLNKKLDTHTKNNISYEF